MTDAARARNYGTTKEGMASGRYAAETGAAQIPEVHMRDRELNGQPVGGLEAKEAHRLVSMVALGKCNILFRHGSNAVERKSAIEYLAPMVKREKTNDRKDRFRFPMTTCECVAAVAVDETCRDSCPTCQGARQTPMDFANAPAEGRMPMQICPGCAGSGKRTYTPDERVRSLAAAWMRKLHVDLNGREPELRAMEKEIRANERLHSMLDAIEWCKGKLLEAERIATEETAAMAERWVKD